MKIISIVTIPLPTPASSTLTMVTMLPLTVNNRKLKAIVATARQELNSIKNHNNLTCEHSSNNFSYLPNKCTYLVTEPTGLPHKLGHELAPRITGPLSYRQRVGFFSVFSCQYPAW